jgi:2'-5' RNA ligase
VIARCFIALELGAAALDAARDAQGLLDADLLRKTTAESLHVTLKFLGYVSVDEVARPVFDAIAPLVTVAPLPSLGRGELSAFPSLGQANVVVLACSDDEGRVAGLAARAEKAAVALGVERETRPFRPHVTLARAKGIDVRKVAKRFEPRALGSATSLTLFESTASGYVALARAPHTASK